MKLIDQNYQDAINANIAVHSAMVEKYNEVEPHFRPESILRVEQIIQSINSKQNIKKVVDLGCGTGFMINILKKYADEIIGIDVTQAMLDKVVIEGSSKITLINGDTGSVTLQHDYFDLATAYTFLDHLYDMTPTFVNTYKFLKSGGVFYADLSPNAYFWDQIKQLDYNKTYDPILEREIKAITQKDKEIEKEFGVKKELFIQAEFQKHTKGGLREEEIKKQLIDIGFEKVDFIYHWYLGQAQLINDITLTQEQRLNYSSVMNEYLIKGLPLTRQLFKYIGFIAIK
jgi:ubiquinone/menaquinone biosynthesis C-methylase UbiE